MKANAVIGQSGGPTSVINASLVGVVEELARSNKVEDIYGMMFGIEGFLQRKLIKLTDNIVEILNTPGAALGSCRYKLKDKDYPKILEILKENNIKYLFMIGGNDTMGTLSRIDKLCKKSAYEIYCVGIPKTVDNDLIGVDHTPGFPSAARYNAISVRHAGILARDMKKVDQFAIYQSIGRKTGWLVAATALARQKPEDAPHIILMPERPFDEDRFIKKFLTVYKEYGWCFISIGEGVCYKDGTSISNTTTKDRFGNQELGAMGGVSAGLALHRIIIKHFPKFRGEFQITESLPMSAADRVARNDLIRAREVGNVGAQMALNQKSGSMVTIGRGLERPVSFSFGSIDLDEVADKTRTMPDEFISKDGFDVTPGFIEYMRPLVGEMPYYNLLELNE